MVKLAEFIEQEEQEFKPLEFDVVEDLCIHMKNDPMFYRKQYYPTLALMQDKLKKGETVDQREMLMPMINMAKTHYCSKYDIPKKPEDLLTDDQCTAIIEKIYDEEMELIRDGAY